MLDRLEEGSERQAPAEERQENVSQELIELKRALREVVRRLEDVLDHVGIEAQRLSDETSRLALVAEKLEARLLALPRSLPQDGPPPETEPMPEPELAVSQEPQFRPGDEGVGIAIAAMPGFQGLMDVQRGLATLPSVKSASVVAYKNGEASLEMVLRAPVTAQQIVERLREATGHDLLIEEARPEALRLRLRFTN